MDTTFRDNARTRSDQYVKCIGPMSPVNFDPYYLMFPSPGQGLTIVEYVPTAALTFIQNQYKSISMYLLVKHMLSCHINDNHKVNHI